MSGHKMTDDVPPRDRYSLLALQNGQHGKSVCSKPDQLLQGGICGLDVKPEVALGIGQAEEVNMRKKFLKVAMSIAALTVAGAVSANAALTMTVSDGVNPTVTITDNGAGDSAPATLGQITWIGSVGIWNLNVDTGLTKPVIGGQFDPQMDMLVNANSTAAGTLTITLLETGFGPLGTDTGTAELAMGMNAQNQITYSAQVNGVTVGSIGPLGPGAVDGTTAVNVSGLNSPFSIGQTVIVRHTAGGHSGGNVTLTVVPEPTTMIAGALLLLPFGISTIRRFRK